MSSAQRMPVHPDEDSTGTTSGLDFTVVGIGASAGGLQTILRFFEQMPADCNMAFVIVLHLSPEHESSVANILQRATAMPVRQVNESVQIEAEHVYVIPPNRILRMTDGHLELSEEPRPRGRHVAIDVFFRTLAEAHGERAISIILSGTGSDGSVGIQRIKERGGVTLAQSPEDAEFDSMPANAIATGLVDLVLPATEMPLKLVELRNTAKTIALPVPTAIDRAAGDVTEGAEHIGAAVEQQGSEHALQEIMAQLQLRTGHDFKYYKRATVLRRIERRMQVNGLSDVEAYRDFLTENVHETPALLKDMLISVTNFFRDREAFEALERCVGESIFKGNKSDKSGDKSDEQVRAWVTGCATGEEAYSVAMLLSEQAGLTKSAREIQVFATDIDEPAIAAARTGAYTEGIAIDVSPTRLHQYFSRDSEKYRVKKDIREKVLFAAHNVLRDPPFSRVDLVCCRNLLIYLDRQAQSFALEMFHFALKPGGLLFLGISESADSAGDLFTVVDKKHRIYRASPAPRGRHRAPYLMTGQQGNRISTIAPLPRIGRAVPYEDIHRELLSQYAPPSILIDKEYNIVHIAERASRFLRHVSGLPSLNILTLIHSELRLDLRTALFQAVKSGKSVDASGFGIQFDGKTSFVNITARPVVRDDREFIMVLFDEVETTLRTQTGTDSNEDLVVAQLEEELQRSKLQLQDTMEHAEASTEELTASNEELQAINEELRSATEELETSKEELQSVNEELVTVNFELKMNIEETSKVNDDLQNLIASTDIATIFVDRALRIKRYTPRASDLFNLIASDVGRSLLDIASRLDYAALHDDIAATFRSLKTVEREVKGPDDRSFMARVLPYRTTDDRIEGAVLTFVDVTGLRAAPAQVRASEARMALVAESTKDYAIVTMDPAGRILTWNLGAEKIFGFSEAEALGQPGSLIFKPEDLDQGVYEAEMDRTLRDGRTEHERWHQRKDGTSVFCSGIMMPLMDEGQVFNGYAKITRDFTNKQRLESYRTEQLSREKENRQAAQAANQLKDEFLAIMSHELKNPLNLIHIKAELLTRIPELRDHPIAAGVAETICDAVVSQAKIIDDLLDLSRMNTGKFILQRAVVDVCQRVRSIVAVAAHDAQVKHIELSLQACEPGVLVLADAVRLDQIIWNLLSNALKFTPAGGRVTVRISIEQTNVRLDVIDTGLGIDPGFITDVFDMFRQANARSVRHDSGLGIGLAIVKQLVEAHGGRVEASSPGLDQGSRFTFWLPVRHDAALAAWTPQLTDTLLTQGLRILLVDDLADASEALAMLLEIDGANVTTARGGGEALGLLEANEFDLLISDIAMPDMDGYELVAALRKLPNKRTLPAIALTGFGRRHDQDKALNAGFDAHIGKPVSLEDLRKTINELTARKFRAG